MVFSSVPLYLDPPNWNQHPNQQQLQGNGTGNENNQHHLIPPHPMPQPPTQVVMGGPGSGPTPIRPKSMAERARMAKIPPLEAPLKCPRCDSTNTKFCYFNNYSLTQPRHFCKTCRRYWTRGGALRNVPVGGGCRRNKRSSGKSSSSGGGSGSGGGGSGWGVSSSSSKSSLSSPNATVRGDRHMDMVAPTIPGIGGGGMTSFMASLQNIAQIGMGNLGLNFGGTGPLHAPPPHHHVLSGIGGDDHHHDHHNQMDFNPSTNLLSHPHAQVQFPNLLGGGFEMPGGALYSTSFQSDHHDRQGVVGGGDDDHHNQMNHVNVGKSSSTMMAPVKMEQVQRLNLAKQFMMGINSSSSDNININVTGSNQFWGGNTAAGGGGGASMWTDLSGLNSSSSSHLL